MDCSFLFGYASLISIGEKFLIYFINMKKTLKKPKTTKKRGKLLTADYIFSSVVVIYGLYSFLSGRTFTYTSHSIVIFPSWYPSYYLISDLLGIFFLVNLILWKKWAVYLAFTKLIIDLMIFSIFQEPNPSYLGHVNILATKITFIILALIIFNVYFWPIYRKWKHFE